ncbi:MAG: lysophospholipid acyltransferase family protein [Pseudomonadota bacterium]
MYHLFRFLSLLPLRSLHAVGAMLGWLVWFLSPAYRATFRANVIQAGLPFALARPAISEAGRFVGELPKLWMRPSDQSCLGNVRCEGRAHADAAFAGGKGVIFMGAHCGSFELAPQALAEMYGPLTALYRPARQPWLARLVRENRGRQGLNLAPASLGGIRQMHKALKRNEAVGLLVDQVPPEGLGLWAPFFGKPAYTMTLAARLALQSGAVILPVTCERLAGGRGYALQILPPLKLLETAAAPTLDDIVSQINLTVEKIVLMQPGQYLWGYNRYKQPRSESAKAPATVSDSAPT